MIQSEWTEVHILETPGTHLNGLCWETLQPYRDLPCPSTHTSKREPRGVTPPSRRLSCGRLAHRCEGRMLSRQPAGGRRYEAQFAVRRKNPNKRSFGGLAIDAKPFGELSPRIQTPWPRPIFLRNYCNRCSTFGKGFNFPVVGQFEISTRRN